MVLEKERLAVFCCGFCFVWDVMEGGRFLAQICLQLPIPFCIVFLSRTVGTGTLAKIRTAAALVHGQISYV